MWTGRCSLAAQPLCPARYRSARVLTLGLCAPMQAELRSGDAAGAPAAATQQVKPVSVAHARCALRGEGGRGSGSRVGAGAGERGGAATAGDVEGVLGGEEWAGRGEKRGRGGWEADRDEGRQVRTRTDRRGGRKRKKGDG